MSDETPVASIRRVAGTGVAVRGDDIDTDQILPARFMKEVSFENMAKYAFYDARYDDDGEPTDHPLNENKGANIMVVNRNFGCGSSREHAPQGLMRWGVEAMVGESFAEIFQDNCESLGIPTMTADSETVEELQEFIEANPDAAIEVDVVNSQVTYGSTTVSVEIDESMREALIEGVWDTTAVMYSNLATTREVAAELPYIDGDGTGR